MCRDLKPFQYIDDIKFRSKNVKECTYYPAPCPLNDPHWPAAPDAAAMLIPGAKVREHPINWELGT